MSETLAEQEAGIFDLLLVKDAGALVARQQDGAPALGLARYWIEVLLAWYQLGVPMDAACAARLIAGLGEEHISCCEGRVFESFLPARANELLGSVVFDESVELEASAAGDYEAVARAVSFERCRDEWLPDPVTCARDAAGMLYRMEYVAAVHALVCLRAAARLAGELQGEVELFLRDARNYLGWSSQALHYSRLKWELDVYDKC